MKATRYHVLLALGQGPLHGAAIQRRVEEESGGAVVLYPAMLYGLMDELLDAGWIREVEGGDAPRGTARWRHYALTPEGRRALEAETARLEAVVGRARSVLKVADGT